MSHCRDGKQEVGEEKVGKAEGREVGEVKEEKGRRREGEKGKGVDLLTAALLEKIQFLEESNKKVS